jgi:plastocyanin
MEIAGADGEFGTDDDAVSVPDVIPGGGSGTLEFNAAAGSYDYQCQFHPDTMQGQITVQ